MRHSDRMMKNSCGVVILSPSLVILSEAKNPGISAQGKLREGSAPKIGIKSFAFSSACAGSRRPFSCRGVSQGDMNDCFVFRHRAQKQIPRRVYPERQADSSPSAD